MATNPLHTRRCVNTFKFGAREGECCSPLARSIVVVVQVLPFWEERLNALTLGASFSHSGLLPPSKRRSYSVCTSWDAERC